MLSSAAVLAVGAGSKPRPARGGIIRSAVCEAVAMSRHHHPPAHKRGWPRIRGAGHSGRGAALYALRSAGTARSALAVLKCTIRPRYREAGRMTKRYRSCVAICHFVEHHKPDPARLAWALFLRGVPMLTSPLKRRSSCRTIREQVERPKRGRRTPTEAQQTEERDLLASQKSDRGRNTARR